MASFSASTTAQMAEYWSDDFRPLEVAGQAIRRALREDEAAGDADLSRQLTDNKGKHLYFLERENDSEQRIVHRKSLPLPPMIVEELRQNVKQYSFMGILAPASLVWVTCDKKLFLWPFDKRAGAHTFEAGSPIITVGLVKPKKDMFPSVEWILVVTTPDEVIQLLLFKADDDTAFKIRASTFNLPTDNVRMLSVVGTDNGRVFLGGEDGCLYEVVYPGGDSKRSHLTEEEILNDFYEKGELVDDTICLGGASSLFSMGKRSFGLSGSEARHETRPQKCRKVNRSSSSWASAVVPDILVKAAGFVFGRKTSTGGGPIVKMVVDEHRQTLYTLSRAGLVCSFALHTEDVQLVAVMDTPRTVQLYLEAVARGQMNPPAGSSSGYISFNGNGLGAQAGVGGMEGARSILKNAEFNAKRGNRSGQKYGSSLMPVSIHVISAAESQHLTLLAVTGCGLRLYVSSLAPNTRSILPSSRLTLCHIRAPPPTDAAQQLSSFVEDTGFVGGVKPLVLGPDKAVRVDAAFYRDGVFLAAIEPKQLQPGSQPPVIGDTIVAAYSDSSFRTVEKSDMDGDQEPEARIPGGIVESARLPMKQIAASAGGGSSILPGGVVVDLAEVSAGERVSLKLAKSSLTPSDNELNFGLPAEYSPPSKTRSHRSLGTNGVTETTSIIVRDDSLAGGIVSLMTKFFPNSVFAKGINGGVSVPGPDSGRTYGGKAAEALYRVSSRDGEEGYSMTAAERPRYGFASAPGGGKPQQATSRSVRLRPTLLKPSLVPLNQLTTQLYSEPTKEVIALNAGGLHFFAVDTILLSLVDALISAGENVGSDPIVTGFFQKYGYQEGCAMCLSLAAGCGPASGQSDGAVQLREHAARAAFARSYKPELLPRQDSMSNGGGIQLSAVDSIVPPGYDFQSSKLCQGLTTLVSRLLRPVWFKPVVVVTEGRILKSAWSRSERVTPAKVEVLLSREKMEQIRSPLASLVKVMKKHFSRALATVPGLPQSHTYMEIDDDSTEVNHITNSLLYSHQKMRAGTNQTLSPVEAEGLARLIEERDIHSLYRLASRAVQVLNLIGLLYKAQDLSELKEVEWGLLHGLTVAQLVESREGQDRVERLLNSLLTASAADGFSKVAPSVMADDIADHFTEQCYTYFSPGSRSAFVGFLRANEALDNAVNSERRQASKVQALDHFRDAAKYWCSAPIITGRILHSRGRESFKDVALRAFQYQSPLAKACDFLIRLGEVAAAVELCLLTAANFQNTGAASTATVLSSGRWGEVYPWEQNLYCKQIDTETGSTSSAMPFSGSPTSPTIGAGGVSVASKDAIDTCYALIFFAFSTLIVSDPDQAFALVSACTASSNRSFLSSFFSFLLDHGYSQTLLVIASPDAEEWIKSRQDPDLLWRYYLAQNQPEKAGEVSFSRAKDTSTKTSLDERIEQLSRAVNAFETKFEATSRNKSVDATMQSVLASDRHNLSIARDTLRIARIQKRVLSAVESRRQSDKTFGISSESYDALATQLITASDLYNDFTAKLYLFEHCLLILHACNHDTKTEIYRLWINLIAEEILPCATRNGEVLVRLQQIFNEIDQAGDVKLLGPNESSGSLTLFENGDWSRMLESRVIGLGQELYGTGADFVFPLEYLLNLLEGLRDASKGSTSPSWSLVTLAKSGVPYSVLVDAYESYCQRQMNNGDRDSVFEQLQNFLTLLELWIDSARKGFTGGKNRGHEDLQQAKATGRLFPRIERLRAAIQSGREESTLLQRLDTIDEAIKYIV